MHNIEGDIRNCIEIANGDYNLSHLDEPMLKYYDELVAKAKAWDKYLVTVEEDAKNEFGDNEDLVKHAVELTKKIFMESADDER